MARSRKNYGDLVFPHLPTLPDQWVSLPDLETLTGLSRREVQFGIRQLRMLFPHDALVSGRQGYRFTLDTAEIDAFRRQQLRAAESTVTMVWTGAVQPALRAAPDALRAKLVARAFTRALEDLHDLANHA